MRGGISDRLISFAAALVGHVRGGLGQINIVASLFFGGVSGSAIADVSAIGGTMIPQMVQRGFDRDFAVNVSVSAALVALLVPPSHNLILYSASAGGSISIADLFAAGIVPALLMTAGADVHSVGSRAPSRLRARSISRACARCSCASIAALPGLLLVALIFVGIRAGVFTAIESACDRGCLRDRRHRAGVPQAHLAALRRDVHGRRAHDRSDPVRDRRGGIVRLAARLPAGARGRGRRRCRAWRTTSGGAAAAERDPADPRHVHGHGAAHHHLHADLPAGGEGLRRRPGAFRRDPDPECRHRAHHAARGLGAVRGNGDRPHQRRRGVAHRSGRSTWRRCSCSRW